MAFKNPDRITSIKTATFENTKFIFEKNLITIANIKNAYARYRYNRSST